jgi:hypothetical protein
MLEQREERCPTLTATAESAIIPTAVSGGGGGYVSSTSCAEIPGLEKKYAYYKSLLEYSETELINKGYNGGQREIEEVLDKLSSTIRKHKELCGKGNFAPSLDCEPRRCADGSMTECKQTSLEKCGINSFSLSQKEGSSVKFTVTCYDGYTLKDKTCEDAQECKRLAEEACKGHCKSVSSCECSSCTDSDGDRPEIALVAKPVLDDADELEDYYQSKLDEVTQLEDVDTQIIMLKKLREEINDYIEELIKSKDIITRQDVPVQKIKIKPGKIEADEAEVETIGKKVIADIALKPVEIIPKQNAVSIKEGELEVIADEVDITEEGIEVANKPIKVAATQVVAEQRVTPERVMLKEESGAAVYTVEGKKPVRVFGLFRVQMPTVSKIDASTGQTLSVNEPWYAAISSG